MRTVIDQRDDYDIPIMDAGAIRALHARFVASNEDGAQLQAVKSKLDADVVPYVDFGVFGPRGARFAKIVKYTAQVWDPTTCTYTPKESKGPRTLDEWRAHWRVYSFALRCFGAVDRARRTISNDFTQITPTCQVVVGGSLRSEHMEKSRRKAEQAYESNPNSGFDPARPWDWVFALATRDRDFWTAHVKDRADQCMHHLKSNRGLRVWLPEYRDEKLKLVILSDSKATLAVVGKERSNSIRSFGNYLWTWRRTPMCSSSRRATWRVRRISGLMPSVECMNLGKRAPCQMSYHI